MDLFDLFAKITLDSSEYEQQMSDASSKTKSFASGLGTGLKTVGAVGGAMVVGAGTAVVGMSKSFVNATGELAKYGDEIDKNSQKLGVSASFYQEWDAVLQHSGTSMDSMTSAFKTLANASQNASEEQLEAFDAIGISIDDLSSMSAEDLFSSVIYGLQDMEEGTERTALASTLLGRGAMEMGALLNTSAEDTQAMIDTVNELGGVLSDDAVKASADYQDSLQDLQTRMTGMKNGIISQFLPSMSSVFTGLTMIFSGDEGGAEMVSTAISDITSTIQEGMPQVLSVVQSIIPLFSQLIVSNLPMIVQTAGSIIVSLVSGISQSLPELIPAVTDTLLSLVNDIIVLLPLLIDGAVQIVVALASGISESLPELLPSIVEMILTIVEGLVDNLDMLIDTALELILALAQGLINALPQLLNKAPIIIIKLVNAILANIPQIISTAIQLIVALGKGLIQAIPQLVANIPTIIKAMTDGIAQKIEGFVTAGANLIEGLWGGISSKTDWIIEKIKGFGDSVLSGIKDFFGIASPSKVMRDQVGKFLAEGVAVGFEEGDAIGQIEDSLNSAMKDMDVDTFGIDTAINATASYNPMDALQQSISALGGDGLGDIIIPVYIGTDKIDEIIVKSNKRQLMKSGGIGYGY